MATHLYVAPASAGKTAYALGIVRRAAQGLADVPRVCLPTTLQVRAWRRRLAAAGGAIGVRLLTFDQLYAECLSAAGQVYTELSPPVRYRLVRAIIDETPLQHYRPLADRPGFVQVLERLIAELKGARIPPERFAAAVAATGDEPRLRELAMLYAAYQLRLQERSWADRAGMGWLAVAALQSAPALASDWPLLVVDGFDSFTQVQMDLLEILAGRVRETIISLTGAADGEQRPVHRRFHKTRARLEERLGLTAEPLPRTSTSPVPVLAHLEAHLFRGTGERRPAGGKVELIAAPDRAAEVRAAMRWLKERLAVDRMRPGEVALLARDIPPYRPAIQQVAREFGLPIRLVDGLPLRSNPAVAALLDLLRLMLPRAADDPRPAMPRRLVLEAWRSPYLDWSAAAGADRAVGIGPGDADGLAAVARWGRVIAGEEQWEEALGTLAGLSPEPSPDEEIGRPEGVPCGPAAQALWDKFRRFRQRLTPPAQPQSCRELVGWLESLIGPDDPSPDSATEGDSLRVVARIRQGAEDVADLDIAALEAFKDILRGLVWAEEAVPCGQPVDYARFFADLSGAIEAASCDPPARPDREEVLVANVIQARGVPLRAVAVLGLAEGEFPATLAEDPFLRDTDRQRLRGQFDLPLEPTTESAEIEFFYETVTRPRERLLLTRPRLTDNGAPWQASPYWEEVLRLVEAETAELTSESVPPAAQAASWGELLESLARRPGQEAVRQWVLRHAPDRQLAVDAAAQLFAQREAGPPAGVAEGDLGALAERLARRFGPQHTWSASRLESYRRCPYAFFIGSVLGLEPREEPVEGLDARQLGTIYHRIFEEVYREAGIPAEPQRLRELLPAVTARVLDEAPEREGFRQTAWWEQTRQEIAETARRSLDKLIDIQGDYVPCRFEAAFGFGGEPPLVVGRGDDAFRLHGFIDRVDRAPDGRLRVIDYKTSSPGEFTARAVAEGKKLQLPLYAQAAQDALGLGEVAEGFYWHVRHAERSSFTLGGYTGGAAAALDAALESARQAVQGIRAGRFAPEPPEGGCPSYCPAAGFCWRYAPGYGG